MIFEKQNVALAHVVNVIDESISCWVVCVRLEEMAVVPMIAVP